MPDIFRNSKKDSASRVLKIRGNIRGCFWNSKGRERLTL